MGTYEQAYIDAQKKGWSKAGETKEQYIKRAKAWNQERYGTTEPTKRAEKWGGGEQGKKNLAAANKDIKHTIATATHEPGTFYVKDSGQSIPNMRAPGVKSYESGTYKAQGHISGGWVDNKTGGAKVFENPIRSTDDETNVKIQTLKAVNLSKNLNDPAKKTQQKTTTPSKTTLAQSMMGLGKMVMSQQNKKMAQTVADAKDSNFSIISPHKTKQERRTERVDKKIKKVGGKIKSQEAIQEAATQTRQEAQGKIDTNKTGNAARQMDLAKAQKKEAKTSKKREKLNKRMEKVKEKKTAIGLS
jgi:hypothetical protein